MSQKDSFDKLPLPELSLAGLTRHFGPGMILMMTGIGTSHLVTAPAAGGRFEYALLWCIPVAYIFKYYGFEMAFRFTHATGRSMLDAYATAWRKWPVWYTLVATLIQCVVGQAGRLAAAAAVAYYFFLEYLGLDLPLGVFGFLLGLLSVVVLMFQRYQALEFVSKLCAGLLVISSGVAYFAEPAPLAALWNFVDVQIPGGSWLIISSFLGLLPTGIDVSLQASEWGKAKKVGMGAIRGDLEASGQVPVFDPFSSQRQDLAVDTSILSAHTLEYCRRWFRIGLWDFRTGHVISFVIACIFLLLAAVWLYPNDVSGTAVIGEIGRVFSESLGSGMLIVFLLGAFAATFSTAFNYFDGWPRVVGACCRNLFRRTASLQGIASTDLTSEHRKRWYSEYNIYRMTMVFSLITASALIAGVPRPVFLVLVASALANFVAPVIFFLNLYYCHTIIPKKDKLFYPSRFATGFGWISLVVFTGMTFLLILDRVFDVALFGG